MTREQFHNACGGVSTDADWERIQREFARPLSVVDPGPTVNVPVALPATGTHKIQPKPTMTEREAQNAGTVATDRQGETPERSGRNDPREIPAFPRPGFEYPPEFEPDVAAGLPVIIDRIANRPPDAALPGTAWAEDHIEETFASIEDRLRVVMDQRDSLLEQIKTLEGQRAVLERQFTRAATYWRTKWMSARRTIKLLIVIGGSVLAVETIALAGMLWRMLSEATK